MDKKERGILKGKDFYPLLRLLLFHPSMFWRPLSTIFSLSLSSFPLSNSCVIEETDCNFLSFFMRPFLRRGAVCCLTLGSPAFIRQDGVNKPPCFHLLSFLLTNENSSVGLGNRGRAKNMQQSSLPIHCLFFEASSSVSSVSPPPRSIRFT